MATFNGKGGSATTEAGLSPMNQFPSPPPGNVPENVPFSGFLNSPVGQRIFGGDQSQEITGGSGTPSSFFQTLQDNRKYWRDKDAAMTPAQRASQQFFHDLANSSPPPLAIQPPRFQQPQSGASLLNALAAMAQNRRIG